jgi:hypothetical protein
MVRTISAAHEDRQHHVVQGQVVGQVEAEQAAARDALQAILAVRERRAQRRKVHHLRQRQRDHRKVDALAPDRK